MKHRYLPGTLLLAAALLPGCQQDKYVLDVYSTMRYDVVALPTAVDTMKLTTVDFVSAREGFVGGAAGALFATTDGGQTWVRRSQPAMGTINKLLFTSATAGWAGTSTGLFRTANGGQTWQAVPAYDAYGVGIAVHDVQFVTTLVGYAVGSGGGICKTTNGGTSWRPVQQRHDKTYRFRAVSFSSMDSGTVIGDEHARWLTTNGGQTWDFYDQFSNNPTSDTGYDVLRFNLKTYQLALPTGFEAYEASQSYAYKPDESYDLPVYGLATAGPRGPVVAVGQRTLIRRHEGFSLNENTPWVSVHKADGTSFEATYYAADFAEASTFYAVGAHGVIHRFHYQ
jgi:hypothetical protein